MKLLNMVNNLGLFIKEKPNAKADLLEISDGKSSSVAVKALRKEATLVFNMGHEDGNAFAFKKLKEAGCNIVGYKDNDWEEGVLTTPFGTLPFKRGSATLNNKKFSKQATK